MAPGRTGWRCRGFPGKTTRSKSRHEAAPGCRARQFAVEREQALLEPRALDRYLEVLSRTLSNSSSDSEAQGNFLRVLLRGMTLRNPYKPAPNGVTAGRFTQPPNGAPQAAISFAASWPRMMTAMYARADAGYGNRELNRY